MNAVSEAKPRSDAELVHAMRSGDRVALADLYDRHAGRLVGLTRHLLHDQRDADDLVHDVFLEAWQRVSEYDARRGSVRTWLSLRTRSRAIDRLRSLALARQHGLLGGGESQAVRFPPPDQDVDRAHVARAIAGLTPLQREVVDLCYFHGLSCREVADRVAVPHGTVKSRLAAAMTALRKELAAGGADDKPARRRSRSLRSRPARRRGPRKHRARARARPRSPLGAGRWALQETERTLAALALTVPPASLHPSQRDDLLGSLDGPKRLESYVPRLADLFDLSLDETRAHVERLDDESAPWEESPIRGVSLYHLKAGPRVADADAGFVRQAPGTEFPYHVHTGAECALDEPLLYAVVLAGALDFRSPD